MNKVVLVGRLTRDPEVRYSQGDNATAVARYTLAVDRRFRRDGEPTADFIPCVIFGRSAEFAEKYFRQGLKIAVTGRIQTGSYTNRDGQKVYTTEVVVEDQEFAEGTAFVLHRLGVQCYEQALRPQSEKLCQEALGLYRNLAVSSPSEYEPYVAMTCNDLAVLLSDSTCLLYTSPSPRDCS